MTGMECYMEAGFTAEQARIWVDEDEAQLDAALNFDWARDGIRIHDGEALPYEWHDTRYLTLDAVYFAMIE